VAQERVDGTEHEGTRHGALTDPTKHRETKKKRNNRPFSKKKFGIDRIRPKSFFSSVFFVP
jgi:hypothetical protein